jgi:hypothetical protein
VRWRRAFEEEFEVLAEKGFATLWYLNARVIRAKGGSRNRDLRRNLTSAETPAGFPDQGKGLCGGKEGRRKEFEGVTNRIKEIKEELLSKPI